MLRISPIVTISICWIVGNVVIGVLEIGTAFAVMTILVLTLIVCLLVKQLSIKMLIILILCLILGGAQRYWVDSHNTSTLQEWMEQEQLEVATIEALGTIMSAVEVDGNRVNFDFKTSQVTLPTQPQATFSENVRVQITLQDELELEQAAQWTRGTSIEIKGELSPPSSATNDGGFDYQRFLYYKHIHWLVKIKGASNVEFIQEKESFNIYQALQLVDLGRDKLAAPFDQLFLPEESGYLKGLILGIREELDPEQFRQFSTLGLTHILAISGLHVAVFMYIVTAFLRMLRFSKEKMIYTLLILIPFYVLFTGGSPSIIRAGIMAMLGLIAAKLHLLKNGLSLIAVTAFALVIIDPYMIHNISFQLSFVVTLGLIIGVPPLSKALVKNKSLKWLTDLLAVTLVAQLVSFPLSIYYFNQFHLLSLVANFMLVPFISFIVMPLASFALFVAHLQVSIAKPIATVVSWFNEASFSIVAWMSKASSLHMIWATPALWWIFVYYGVLLWGTKLVVQYNERIDHLNKHHDERDSITAPLHGTNEYEIIFPVKKQRMWHSHKLSPTLCVIMTIVTLLYGYYPNAFSNAAIVSFIDIGQGDASFIRTAEGKHILIDGGGTISFLKDDDMWKKRQDPFEVGKDVLVPLLMKRGVHQLDILIISHLDSDHIGGLIEVIRTIPVKEIWWNGSYRAHQDVDELFTIALEKNINLRTPLVGDKMIIDKNTSVEILWPLEMLPHVLVEQQNQNEHSLVLLLNIYETTFLYTGDIGVATEEALVARWHEASYESRAVDVMKVAHHGSRHSTSYTWLSVFEPVISVISSGKYNTYGHPHPDTLSRLKDYDSIVFRTDLNGEVQFRIEKDKLFHVSWK